MLLPQLWFGLCLCILSARTQCALYVFCAGAYLHLSVLDRTGVKGKEVEDQMGTDVPPSVREWN